MTKILLSPQRLDTESSRFTQASADINFTNREIGRLVSSLDWQVRSRGNVESLIERAASEGKTLAAEAERLGQYLRLASQTFQEADMNAKTSLVETTCMVPISTNMVGGVAVAGGFIVGLVTGGQGIFRTGLSWIKKVIGVTTSNSIETQKIDEEVYNLGSQKPNVESTTFPVIDPNWTERVIKLPVTNIDSFNGVSANYSTEQSINGLNYNVKGYQCSDYVKNYYKYTYKYDSQGKPITGIIINNLLPNDGKDYDGVPHFEYTVDGHKVSGSMENTKTPRPGDVVSVGDGKHWAIVKGVEENSVIVIEQNYMFKDNKGQIVAPVNRRVEIQGTKFYRIP
jgi:hypothetical protein